MIIQDQGQLWMIGVKSGKWYRRDGKSWVEDVPRLTPALAPAHSISGGKEPLKQRFQTAYSAKPAETPAEKSYRRLTIGVTAAFLILLVLSILAGLMFAGLIQPPRAISGLFGAAANGGDGVGAEAALAAAPNLAGSLISLPESGLSIPGELALKGYLYTKDIRGAWQLRDDSAERLVFRNDGTLLASSEADGYDFSGWYSFVDDHTIQLFLGDGAVQSAVWIDAGVLTLEIDGLPLVYDRVE